MNPHCSTSNATAALLAIPTAAAVVIEGAAASPHSVPPPPSTSKDDRRNRVYFFMKGIKGIFPPRRRAAWSPAKVPAETQQAGMPTVATRSRSTVVAGSDFPSSEASSPGN